jgi:adenylate cyclase
MSFFDELKRRNVFRVAVAYGVAAWVLLQVADLVLDNVEAPGWVMDVFMLVVVLGFVVAVVVAWAYELTPEGIKKESEVDRSQSITNITGKKLDRVIILFLVLAVSVLLVERSMKPTQTMTTDAAATGQPAAAGTETSPSAAAEPSIAVLPFVNMSADEEQEYFSDGIAEELLNLLVRVEGLKVASRTSSFVYKGENLNIPAIAGELKVDHILEGSVRKAGERVRITAQLIDVASDRHLWSDTFDRELTDIFAIQDEIANAIVGALKDELGVGLQAVSVESTTENLDAYDLYLKARGLFIARQDLAVANDLFRQATRLDPDFVLAWEGLAASESVSSSWLAGDGIDHNKLSVEAARKALELDPNLSMPYAVLGMKRGMVENYGISMQYLDRAVENDPKNSTAWLWRGITLREMGFVDRAIADFEQCLAIDPAYQNCRQHMATSYLYGGKPEPALRLYEESIRENFHSTDDSFVSHFVKSGQMTTAYLAARASVFGEYAPVKDWIDAIRFPDQNQSARIARWRRWVEGQNMSECNLGDVIVALRLDHCYTGQNEWGSQAMWSPDAAYFRKTPAFKDFASRKFLGYWSEHGFPPQCRDLGEGDFECD